MGLNGFICEDCGNIVDFSMGDEAMRCDICEQFDMGDGITRCYRCALGKNWNRCNKCHIYICNSCYEKRKHVCYNSSGIEMFKNFSCS